MSGLNTKRQQKDSSNVKKEETLFKAGDKIIALPGGEVIWDVLAIAPDNGVFVYNPARRISSFISPQVARYYTLWTPPPPKGTLFVPVYRYTNGNYFTGTARDNKAEFKTWQKKFLDNAVSLVAIKEIKFTEGEGLDLLK